MHYYGLAEYLMANIINISLASQKQNAAFVTKLGRLLSTVTVQEKRNPFIKI